MLFSLVLISVCFGAKAQTVESTTFRGAFAPAPTKMWTDGWANWDPENTPYAPSNVNVSGTITTNTTWTSNNVYLLQGVVYVLNGVTLTIEPGTVIRGDNATPNSSLLVARGGKLIAEGTVCNPIVFTSNKAVGSRARGDWGGILILGKAKHNLGSNNLIEGLSNMSTDNFHGGTDDADNSGVLKYVRIEFGGFLFSNNNEINGLTMGSVGNGTTIDYVQTSFINDDAFEWFGGSVNAKHLIAYRCLDDDFDTDNGWSGTVQYGLAIKDPAVADNPTISTSEGFESDNDAAGTNVGLAPKTSGRFLNITQIGAFRCGSNTAASGVQPTANGFRRGARIRRNSDLKIVNSIFMNNWRGLFVDGALSLSNMDEDSLVFRSNIIAGDFTTAWTGTYAGASLAAENATTRSRLNNPLYSNDSINTCNLLTNAWSFTNPDYRPNTAGAGAIVTDGTNLSAGSDLFQFVDIAGSSFAANEGKDFMLSLGENGFGATSGQILISIPKLSGYDITVPGNTLSTSPTLGTNANVTVNGVASENANWLFYQNATTIFAVSKPGAIIGKFGAANIGFRLTRKASLTFGTLQNLGIDVVYAADSDISNNGSITALSTSN